MSDIALSVEGIRKSYLIGAGQAPYSTIRDSIASGLVAPIKRAVRLLRGEAYGATNLDKEFWALDGVSFEVAAGEVLGIIGPNGAGKTTLLKILSRITEPTEGRARVFGRVSSLLEVGTGFHPELTGRENVQLNGAILGMRRADLQRRFDEIVDFAEVEQFIDTPVKFYSTGMQMRLAFSVAAHLEPDILLVDEVLAVGDVAFQRKCIGKMESVTGEGRTVVFVSHNMGTVGRLCDRGVLLEHGKVTHNGRIDGAIARYLETVGGSSGGESAFQPDDSKSMAIRSIRVLDAGGRVSTTLDRAKPFCIEVTYRVNEQVNDAFVAATFSTADDSATVCVSRDTDGVDGGVIRRSPGEYTARIEFEGDIINVNSYYARIGLVRSGSRAIDLQRTPTFELYDAGDLGNYQTSLALHDRTIIVAPVTWCTETVT